jgi:hypothetical protein
MRPGGSSRRGLPWLVCSGLGLMAAAWSGCGGSSERVAQLSEEARKSVFQKKVDVTDRSAASARAAKSTLKGRGGRP